jgi:hypothetical protein
MGIGYQQQKAESASEQVSSLWPEVYAQSEMAGF